jgi:hypothetical protein
VAAALTAVLAGAVLATVIAVLHQGDRVAGAFGTSAQAHLVLDALEQDLQGAIFRPGRGVGLAATVLPDTTLSGVWKAAAIAEHAKPGNTHPRSLHLGAPDIADTRFGVAGVWLRFVTIKQDSGASAADLSAPVAVGYQLVRRNVTSSATADPRYQLFRAEVRRAKTAGGAPGTFEAGYDLDPAASPATAYLTPSGTTGDPGNLLRPPLGCALADNIIDFGLRLHVREGGSLRLIFPAAVDGTPTTASPPAAETVHLAGGAAGSNGDRYSEAFPEVIDVMIRVLDSEGARRIAAYEDGRLNPPPGTDPGDYWWTLAEANSAVFTRRIVMASRAFP